jgi:hypothetical protein
MNRSFVAALTGAAIALLVNPLAAKALVVRMPSLQEKVVQSDVIVVGKVQALEEKPVEASPFPGSPQKTPYTIASIRITESLAGVKNVTNIRVGFIPQPKSEPATDPAVPIRPIRPRGGMANPELKVGQEGCFFLQKHPDGDFLVLTPMAHPVDAKDENFKKQLELIQKSLKMLAEPVVALQSKNADERLQTASLLLQKYRQFRNTTGKAPVQAPIPAEQSRLILQAIAEADWTRNDPENMMQSGQMLFNMLGVQAKDGWTPPKPQAGQNYQELYQKAAKSWLKENAARFRIQMWINESK